MHLSTHLRRDYTILPFLSVQGFAKSMYDEILPQKANRCKEVKSYAILCGLVSTVSNIGRHLSFWERTLKFTANSIKRRNPESKNLFYPRLILPYPKGFLLRLRFCPQDFFNFLPAKIPQQPSQLTTSPPPQLQLQKCSSSSLPSSSS